MSANEYGAYTFGSEANFCKASRWIISGSMDPLWGDEPKPVLVRRGTAIHELGVVNVDCSTVDDRLSMVHGTLVKYVGADGEMRYAQDRDVYTVEDYNVYRELHKPQPRMVAHHEAPLPYLALPATVAARGYEGAVSAALNDDIPMPSDPPCNVALASRYC